MKKIILLIVTAAVILIGVLVFNTIMLSSKQVSSEKIDKISLPNDVFENLSEGLKYRTISFGGDAVPDSTAFFGFHRFLKKTFPLTHSKLQLEKINTYSLLYTWKGIDSLKKPIILLSHQDVVPVDQPTLNDWEAGPFEGKISDTDIIGRGTLDDKGRLLYTSDAADE